MMDKYFHKKRLIVFVNIIKQKKGTNEETCKVHIISDAERKKTTRDTIPMTQTHLLVMKHFVEK